ncbi:MAG: AsmA family protein [Parvibaculum sp.]|uniref:AsmA family protein n=1 Tax=Parvibaculum sp. TaxID=2024848 RepID=UPI0034A01080
MNSILTYIAGIIVALLFAALVGPNLIDWNKFRGEIEAQASNTVGMPVRIDGDIRLRILPAPHMTLGKVKIANTHSAARSAHIATFDEIDAEVGLTPLIGGDIKVTSVRVVRPQINLEVMPDGSTNWNVFELPDEIPGGGMFSLASVSLEEARFENGVVAYQNRANGRSWRAEQVGGEVIATSLVGPLRAEIEAVVDGVPLALRFGLGEFAGRKAFQVTADLQLRDRPAKFLFSGVATEFSAAARLDGNGRLEIGPNGNAAPVRVESGLVATAQSATFRNLTVTAGGTALNGSAQARWEGRPVFSVELTSENFTAAPLLDRLLPRGADDDVPLAPLLAFPLPDWIDGGMHVSVATLVLRDAIVRNAELTLALADGVLEVETARGELGGRTEISFAGRLTRREEVPVFDGSFDARSGNLAALAHWLAADSDEAGAGTRIAPRGDAPFSARARLRLTPDAFDISDLRADYSRGLSTPSLRGDIGYRIVDGRPRLDADLRMTDFDADPLRALLSHDRDPLEFLTSHDIALRLRAERLRIWSESLRGLDTEATLTDGALDVQRLEVDDVAGARFSFSGQLTGITTGRRDDVKGNFTGHIEGERFGGLLALGGFSVPDASGPVSISLAGVSGEATDSELRVDTLTLKGTVRGSRVDAVLKRRHGAGGSIEGLDIVANAANDEGRVLLQQLGLDPSDGVTAPGSVSLQLESAGKKPYQVNFRANVGSVTLTAKGRATDPFEALRFEGRADIAAPDVLSIFAAFGAPEPLSNWVGEQASGPGFVFSSAIVWDKQSLSLSNMENVAGNFRLSGNIAWRAGGGDKLPSLTGALEANAFELTSLASAEDEVWPAAALDWSVLGSLDGEVDLKSGTVRLGSLAFGDVTTHLSLSHGVLSASPFVGAFAGGRVSLGARIEGGKGAPGIGLTVLIEEANLGRVFREAFGASPGKGQANISAQLQAQGRSWLALVSSASGAGTIKVVDLAFAPLDVAGFGAALGGLTDIEEFPSLVSDTLESGETPASGLDGGFTIENGVLRLADDDVTLDGGVAKLLALYDLPRLTSDAELTISLAKPEGTPSFSIVATGRDGQVETKKQMLELQSSIAAGLLAESLNDAGGVPRELRELMGLPAETRTGPVPQPLPRPAYTQ